MKMVRHACLLVVVCFTAVQIGFAGSSPSLPASQAQMTRHRYFDRRPSGQHRYVPDELILLMRQESAGGDEENGAFISNDPSLQKVFDRFKISKFRKIFRHALGMQSKTATPGGALLRDRLARVVKVKITGDPLQAAAVLRSHPGIVYVEPNYIGTYSMIPDDPYYHSRNSWSQNTDDLWGLKNEFGILMENAWDVSLGEEVTVGLVDSGVQLDHEDIAANIWTNPGEIPGNGVDDDGNGFVDDMAGWNFGDDSNVIQDAVGHGTHVAGTIAAIGNNGAGIIGVAPRAKIIVAQAGDDPTIENFANALIYVADRGARVINNSWGVDGRSELVADAVAYAQAQGAIVVAAAGNSEWDANMFVPTSCPGVISVGAIGPQREKAWFSNFGDSIDVVAPGEEILSLLSMDSGLIDDPLALDGKYIALAGTSMSSPHVAGLAALILQQHPQYNAAQVRHLIQKTAIPLATGGWNKQYGFGLINARAALDHAAMPDIEALLTTPDYFGTGEKHYYGKGNFEIHGTAAGADFASYTLSYAPFSDGTLGAFKTFYTSSRPAEQSYLQTFDTGSLPDGRYLIKLSVTSRSGVTVEDYKAVVRDSSLKAGWPQQTQYPFFAPPVNDMISELNPVLADIDGDGVADLLTASNNALYAWDAHGSSLTGFPIYLDYAVASALSVADIDGDGDLEIFFSVAFRKAMDSAKDMRTVYAFHHDGSMVTGFPAKPIDDGAIPGSGEISVNGFFPIALADMDHDGQIDLIQTVHYTDHTRRLYKYYLTVLNNDGSIKPGWPRELQSYHFSGGPVAVGDFDNDGNLEIFASAKKYYFTQQGAVDEYLYLFNADGTIKHETMISVADPAGEFAVYGQSIVVDIDHDGDLEIFYISRAINDPIFEEPFSNDAYLLDHELNPLPGWPQTHPIQNAFAFIDVDEDPELEIVAYVDHGYLVGDSQITALNLDGSVVSGYPKEVLPRSTNIFPNWGGTFPLVASTNQAPAGALFGETWLRYFSDFGPEMAFYAAFDTQGRMLSGWPKLADMQGTMPSIGDMEGDGLLEYALHDYKGMVYVWEEDARDVGGFSSPYYTFRANYQRTNVYGSADPCEVFTATNQEHVAQGRAEVYKKRFVEYARTIGSGESLGRLGSRLGPTTTVSRTGPGYYEKGDQCASSTSHCIEALNSVHISEGRAHTCGILNLYACANGSEDNLGRARTGAAFLQETAPGYWEKCE